MAIIFWVVLGVLIAFMYVMVLMLNWYEQKQILRRGDHATAEARILKDFIEYNEEQSKLSKAFEVPLTPAELELQRKWERDDWRNSN